MLESDVAAARCRSSRAGCEEQRICVGSAGTTTVVAGLSAFPACTSIANIADRSPRSIGSSSSTSTRERAAATVGGACARARARAHARNKWRCSGEEGGRRMGTSAWNKRGMYTSTGSEYRGSYRLMHAGARSECSSCYSTLAPPVVVSHIWITCCNRTFLIRPLRRRRINPFRVACSRSASISRGVFSSLAGGTPWLKPFPACDRDTNLFLEIVSFGDGGCFHPVLRIVL